MYHAPCISSEEISLAGEQRQQERLIMRCPARVRIGNRQYAAYLENISEGGAKIRTLTQIVSAEKVSLLLPDLDPINGKLRWSSGEEGGLVFMSSEDVKRLRTWIADRALKKRSCS